MSVEGLDAILAKEPVVFTRKSQDMLERPAEVEAYYRAHIRTYVPMHSGVSGVEQPDVEIFARRLVQQVRGRRAPLGYITADFGYGKTSAGIYLWNQAAEASVVVVPPFQLNSLLDLVIATYGWVNYTLSLSKPSLQAEALRVYSAYGESNLTSLADRYGGDLAMIQRMYEDGFINLDLRPADIVQFFDEMTALVVEAGFEGLLLICDEVQQYLEPSIKSGKGDPIGPLFNVVQEVGSRQGKAPFGLLFIIPQKELSVINDQRGDLIDRMREMALDLKTIYDQEFPARLWAKLATVFEFEEHADRMVSQDTLRSIGQIATRADLANGPRTVINTFQRITARYRELKAPRHSPYTPIDLIDDFLAGAIKFDGTKRIQEVVQRALSDDMVRGKPKLEQAIKLAAAFPVGGVKADLQAQYQLREAFAELLNSAFGTLVTNTGERNSPGTLLLGLQQAEERRDWLDIVLSEFNRNFYENAALTKLRTARAFGMLLIQKVFKSENWSPKSGFQDEGSDTRGHSLVFEGAFPSFAREFPKRIVQVRILVDDGHFRNEEPAADTSLDFHLRRYLDLDEHARQEICVPAELILEENRAHITINLMQCPESLGNRALETTLMRVIPAERLTPLFLLTLYSSLQNQIDNARVPKSEVAMLTSQLLPALLESVLAQVLNANVGSKFDAAGVRLIDVLLQNLLTHRYGTDYHTLMAMKTGWQTPLRGYISALNQLDSAAEKQGDLDVEGTKDEIAKHLSMSNTSFDTFLSNFPQLLEVVRDFRSKPKGQPVASGAVRFRLHPLEEKIASWLEESPHTKLGRDKRIHVISVNDVKQRARQAGYKDTEIDQLLEIMEAREMILRDKDGNIEQKLRAVVSYEEAVAQVTQLQTRIGDIQRAFPDVRGLGIFIEHSQKLVEMLPNVRKKGSEKLIEQIAIKARNIYRSVEEIGEGCVHDLATQLGITIQHTPSPDTTVAIALSEPVSGSPQFVPSLEEIRIALLQAFDSTSEAIEASRARLSEIKAQLEANNVAYENLAELTGVAEEAKSKIEELRRQLSVISDQRRFFILWRRTADEWSDLSVQLHQLGDSGVRLVQHLEEMEAEIASRMAAQFLAVLPQADYYQKQLTDLREEMRRIEGEAKGAFGKLQEGYLRLLRDVGCKSLWNPIIFSSQDPDGVYEQLYQYVHRAVIHHLDELDDLLQQQHNRLHQRRINTTQEGIEQAIDELLAAIEQQKKRLPYSQANDIENIRSFESVFPSIISAMENVWTSLKTIQIEVERLEKSVESPDLTPDERHILEVLSENELTDLSALVATPENVNYIWQAVRSLWEKGRVRIGIGIVE